MTDKTKTVSVRLNVETLEALNKRLDAESLSLRDFLSNYAGKDGFKTGVNTAKPHEGSSPECNCGVNTSNVAKMAELMGSNFKEVFEAFERGLEDGSLDYSNGRIVGVSDLKLDGLYEVCHEKNIEPQKAIDKAVQMLWK